MPRLPEFIQEPLALFAATEEINKSQGRIPLPLDTLPIPETQHRITLLKLANHYGEQLGPTECMTGNHDPILDVEVSDFQNIQPSTLARGLYIPPNDPRYRDRSGRIEQLVKVQPLNNPAPEDKIGVVFPAREFHVVARSPSDLVRHVMAKTRRANQDNPDEPVVEACVGRSAAHALESKIVGLNGLENDLITVRHDVLIPLYREARRNGARHWKAHYGVKRLNGLRKDFDDIYHEAIHTASLNMEDIKTVAVKGMHRAAVSRLYREPSVVQRSHNWQEAVVFIGNYVNARRNKVVFSRDRCQQELQKYDRFLNSSLHSDAA